MIQPPLITATYNQARMRDSQLCGKVHWTQPGVHIEVTTFHGEQGSALAALKSAYDDVRQQLISTEVTEEPK